MNALLKVVSLMLHIILCAEVSFGQWVQAGNGMAPGTRVYCFLEHGQSLFTGTLGRGVYKSDDMGENWYQTPSLGSSNIVSSLVGKDNIIFAGTLGNGVFKSTNNGDEWIHTSLKSGQVYALCKAGDYILAGLSPGGLRISSNNGESWDLHTLNDRHIYSLGYFENILYAGTGGYGIYKSTDKGTSWIQTSLNSVSIYCMAYNDGVLLAGTPGGVYYSMDKGISWTHSLALNTWVLALDVSGNYVFAGMTYSNSFYYSPDNGNTWIQKVEGFDHVTTVSSLFVKENLVQAGTFYHKILKRSIEDITSVQNVTSEIPQSFSLAQNFPNPFNPETKIRFDIRVAVVVTLRVFDAIGKEVTTLVNESLTPGSYETTFDATGLTSGVYFYRLEAKDFVQTKRMVLVK